MANEKTQGTGAVTEEAPGENTVQITFLPEGKTVTFEHGNKIAVSIDLDVRIRMRHANEPPPTTPVHWGRLASTPAAAFETPRASWR